MMCKFFNLKELVSEQVYKKYGSFAWHFLDSRLLETIDFLREKTGKPITINNWAWGGHFDERGFRANLDPLVKKKTQKGSLYCSPHILGKGVDFDIEGLTAQEGRELIIKLKENLPYPIRLEDKVSWIHLDLYNDSLENKIKLFNP